MATFRNRLASTQQIVLVFAACAFPVHVWSILIVLRNVPAWILKMNSQELISVIAYTQAFALLESVIILLVLLLLGAILPARSFRDRFVAHSSMAVFVTSGWVAVAHYVYSTIPQMRSPEALLLGLALYLASIGAFYVLILRYKRLEELIRSFAERLLVLLFVYVSIDVLSIVVVILRHI